jgi:hypothetical protein
MRAHGKCNLCKYAKVTVARCEEMSYIPTVCYRGSLKECAIECNETFLSSTLLYSFHDSLVSWGVKLWRVFDVLETHC